jgi:hypothetical protein
VIRTQIQLTESQSRSLKEIAVQEQTSIAELIRQAVNYWLRSVSPTSLEERKQRALEIVGQFHSGKSDISEQHDDYLAEAYGA